MGRKIRMGMIGGGRGAFIGNVHRMAAALDGQIELVCGAFSSDAQRSKQSGADLFLPEHRVYEDFRTMIETERQLSEDERMDFVSIVTPNHVHYEPAMLAMENGFHVVCDKPLCYDLEEAVALRDRVVESDLIFALTYNYTAYPMVKQARAMIANGDLGRVRRVMVRYSQGWLSTFLEGSDQKQAAWRTDPNRSGIAGAMSDIGSHAEHLMEYVSGLRISELCADLDTVVTGRRLDDVGSVLLRFQNGATGMMTVSQISAGEENNLAIRVYGELGGLEWRQQQPNDLTVRWLDQPMQVFRTGVGALYPQAQVHTRLPAGHPEGFLEAFANIYRNVAFCIRARIQNEIVNPLYEDFPTVHEGLRSMQFIQKVVESSRGGQKWLKMD